MRLNAAICIATAALLSGGAAAAQRDAAPRLADLNGVWDAQFNHDGSRVVVQLRAGTVGIWDVARGTQVRGDVPHSAKPARFSMSADGKLVAIAAASGTRVYDAGSAKAVSPILDARLHGDASDSPLFSPDGETLAVWAEGDVSLWNVRSGNLLARIAVAPRGDDAELGKSIQFTRNGKHCFIMERPGYVTRYDAQTGKPSGEPMQHPAAESAYGFDFSASADGRWLATSDDPGENGPTAHLQLWDATAAKPVGEHLAAVNGFGVQFLAGLARVLITPARGDAHVRELPGGEVVFTARSHDEVDGPSAAVSADEKWILTWGASRRIDVHDAASGELKSNFSSGEPIAKVLFPADSSTCYVVFDRLVQFVRSYYETYIVKFKLPEMTPVVDLHIPDHLHRVSLSPDGRRILSVQGVTDKERIVIYDASSLQPLAPSR